MSSLDQINADAAVKAARRHLARGRPVREAALIATRCPCAPYRDDVLAALGAGRADAGRAQEFEPANASRD